MKNITMHILYPATAAAIFPFIAMLPVELLGCRNCGLIAAVVAVIAGIAGIFSAVKALMGKIRGDAKSFLWIASALIFAVPAIYIVIVAA